MFIYTLKAMVMFIDWIRQAVWLALTSTALFLTYCLAALWITLVWFTKRSHHLGKK